MSIRVDFPRLALRLFVAPVLVAAALVATSSAEVLIVSNGTGSINGGDGCSLREAVINANTDSKQGSIECPAGSGADVIILPPQTIYFSSSVVEEADAAEGDLDISTEITIWGGGQQMSRLSMSQFSKGRFFDVLPGARLTLRGIRLDNGFAADQGGGIRVAAAAELHLEDVGIVEGAVDPVSVAGKGGALYLAGGSTTTIVRSAIIGGEAEGVLGEGAGIYCDGCDLTIDTTTFARNRATASGGGLYAAAGSNVALNYVSFGFNTALMGAAVHSLGDLTLHAALLADNGAGTPGDDLECSGGSFAATYSFAEFPDGCAPLTGVQTRADLPGDTRAELLRDIQFQKYDDQPSTILQWNITLPSVPAVDCVGHRDQHFRAAGDQVPCNIGAFQRPGLGVNPMRYWNQVQTSGPLFNIGISMSITVPDRPTRVVLSALGGIGEDCDFADLNFDFGTGDYAVNQLVDPDSFFLAPTLGRVDRVCELEGRVVSGDPTLIGMSTGLLRVVFHDTSLASASSISIPASGSYLVFGTVPVGGTGSANVDNIYYKPAVPGWSITGVTITGANADRFELDALADPAVVFPLAVDASGAVLPLRCRGGILGDYDAEIEVATDNPSFPVLIYGLRCRVAHLLSLVANKNVVDEDSLGAFYLTAELDSPSILAAPLTFSVLNVPGTAVASSDVFPKLDLADPRKRPDYQAFAGTFTLNPGEQGVVIPLTVIDDLVFQEGAETFGAELALALRSDVELSGTGSVSLRIDDDDVPAQGLSAVIAGVPAVLASGNQFEAEITATNTSDIDRVRNMDVAMEVDDPLRVIGFVVTRVIVTCDAHRAWLVETIEDPVAEAAALAAFELDCPALSGGTISSDDEANEQYALALRQGAFCSINSLQQLGRCAMAGDVPQGTVITVRAVLETAIMADPPKLDYPGAVQVKARGSIGTTAVAADQEAGYIIKGKVSGGAGALGLPALLVAGLLAFRGRRKRSAGREGRWTVC